MSAKGKLGSEPGEVSVCDAEGLPSIEVVMVNVIECCMKVKETRSEKKHDRQSGIYCHGHGGEQS